MHLFFSRPVGYDQNESISSHISLQRAEEVRSDKLERSVCGEELHQRMEHKMCSPTADTVLTILYGRENAARHLEQVVYCIFSRAQYTRIPPG